MILPFFSDVTSKCVKATHVYVVGDSFHVVKKDIPQ